MTRDFYEHAYKARLALVRKADAKHTADMEKLLEPSGVSLARARSMEMHQKDRLITQCRRLQNDHS